MRRTPSSITRFKARQDGDSDDDPFGGALTAGEIPTGVSSPAPSGTAMADRTFNQTSPSGWSFEPVPDAVSCQPLEITWSIDDTIFTDLDRPMSLVLVDSATATLVPANAGTITTEVGITAGSFNWTQVTVPTGKYLVRAHELHMNILSAPFTVTNGPDTSCIPADVLAGSSSTSASSPSSTSSPSTHSGTTSPSTSSGTASSSQNTTLPIIAAASSGKAQPGAIAGGVIGGIVALGLLALAAWYFLAFRKRAALIGKKRPTRDGWGGLDSVDYKPTSSVLPTMAPGSTGPTPRPSISTTKSPFGDVDYLPPISARPSLASLREKGFTPSPTNLGSPTSPSSHEMAPLPATPVPAAHRYMASSPVPDPFATPAVVPATEKAMRRSSRSQRKPVPAYEPTPEELAQLAIARSQSESGRSDVRSEAYAPSIGSTSRQPSVKSTILSGSPVSSSVLVDPDTEAMIHSLKSKSSGTFELEKPMHYLMPDPPMPPPS